MDLSRGMCILCTNNTKIIVPPQAEDTTFLLKDILGDQIDSEKFEKINAWLKVCPMCIHDLVTVAEHKANIKEGFSEDHDTCILCYSETHLIHIKDWTHFDKVLENVTHKKRLAKCLACLNCIKCLDLLERIKTNLFRKYPSLELDHDKDSKMQKISPTTKNKPETHKKSKGTHKNSKVIFTSNEESNEESDYSSKSQAKTINNLKSALKHLKPLKNSTFNIDEFKQDNKLLKQIAFVKLRVSNLLTKNYKLEHSSEGSKKSTNLSDTDSSRDSPSPKNSFFKIRLKINPNKVKTQRVTQGKVTKPKGHKSKLISENKKELVVKILKMNFDQISNIDLNTLEIRTPTKASRKMLPEECPSSSKKRKSVTFAEVLDTEIIDGSNHKENADTTPLKTSLKSRISSKSDLLDTDSDQSDNENKKALSPHSKEDLETPKSYVEDIIKNNDNIFDSLKASESPEPKPAKVKGNSSSIDSNKPELNSENNKINDTGKKEEKIDKLEDKKKKRKHTDSEDSESEEGKSEDKEKTPNKNENQKNGIEDAELKKNNRKRIKYHINSDNESANENEENKVISEESRKNKDRKRAKKNRSDDDDSDDVTKSKNKEKDDVANDNKANVSNKSKCHADIHFVDIATINDEEDTISEVDSKKDEKKDSQSSKTSKKSKSKKTHQKHKKRKRSNSANDSDTEESKAEKDDKDLSENEDQQSTGNDKIVRSDVKEEISLSKCFQDVTKPNGSETSIDDKDVTLEEFKALRKSNLADAGSKEVEETNSIDIIDEDSNSETLLLNDEDITDTINNLDSTDKGNDNVDNVVSVTAYDKNRQTDKKLSSDIESESEKNNKSNGSYDSSSLKSKSKKKSEHTIKTQEEDVEVFSVSATDEESEKPETKREKVSGVDLNKTDSNTSRIKKKDMPLEVTKTQRDVGAIDSKVDELIAKYTNPSIPNLNNDNVSDNQNFEARGENQGRKSESPARESQDKVDLPTKVKEVISEKNDENVNTTVLGKNINENNITKNNDTETTSNVTLKDSYIDDFMENIGDSC